MAPMATRIIRVRIGIIGIGATTIGTIIEFRIPKPLGMYVDARGLKPGGRVAAE
jgi:hypothetical protein